MKKKNYSKVELKALEIVSSTICGTSGAQHYSVEIGNAIGLPGTGSGTPTPPTAQNNIIYAD